MTEDRALEYRVFVVDDEPLICKIIGRLINSIDGCKSFTFTDPREAVLKLGEYNPEALVTDYEMPYMNGAEVLENARRLSPDTKRILCSTHGKDLNLPEGLADAYLLKPFENEVIKETIKRLMGIE